MDVIKYSQSLNMTSRPLYALSTYIHIIANL